MTAIEFQVLGRPQPAGSKRAFAVRKAGVPTGAVAVADANPRAKGWQQEVRQVASDALDDGPLLDGPLGLDVSFFFARPASHYRTGRNAALLRDAAPTYPVTRPDATKCLRACEDALTGQVWRDDAQVVVQSARKLYGVPERCVVRVWQIEPEKRDAAA